MPDPGRPRLLDTHVHFWDPARPEWYAHLSPEVAIDYLGGDVTAMKIRYDADTYHQESTGWQVDGIVHVSASTNGRAYLAEMAWLTELAPKLTTPLMLIGAVDPTLDAAAMEGDLADRELIFDLVTYPGEMAQAAEALARFPDAVYVVEHTGWPWPDRFDDPEYFALWQQGMSVLSQVGENVHCKLSGLPMSTHDMDIRRMRPWIEHCLEVFVPAAASSAATSRSTGSSATSAP
jgi:L-fuconolactonase